MDRTDPVMLMSLRDLPAFILCRLHNLSYITSRLIRGPQKHPLVKRVAREMDLMIALDESNKTYQIGAPLSCRVAELMPRSVEDSDASWNNFATTGEPET